MTHALVLSEKDNVATALADLAAGTTVLNITLRDDVPFGHKLALRPIAPGEHVIKYGYPIGAASAVIEPGEHVHVHNVEGLRGRGDLEKEAR